MCRTTDRGTDLFSLDSRDYLFFSLGRAQMFGKFLRSLVLLLSLPFGASAWADTVTLMDGLNSYGGTTDTRLINMASPNEGTATTFAIIDENATALAVRFKIFQAEGGPVPNGATITSATLAVYKFDGPASSFKASRFLKDWNESADWNVTGAGQSWTTAGARSAGNDYLATPDGTDTIGNADTDGCQVSSNWPAVCWLTFDVTSGVQAFAANPTTNFGWKIADTSGTSGGTPRYFNSSENSNWPSLRPKLTINYGSGGCTTPTASFTTTPSSGPAPLNVVFNASASSDGGGPITSLRLQFGDGTPDAVWSSKTQTQSHTYTTGGQKVATLTASNACGSSTPVTKTINVGGQPPTANLGASPQNGAPPLLVNFSAAASSDGDAPITALRLQFGDGTEVNWGDKTVAQPHQYTSAGQFIATLTATNAYGTSAPATRTITVGAACSGDIAPTETTPAGALGTATPTFHSMGLYYNPGSAPSNGKVWMRYRKACEAGWREGYPLWYDTRTAGLDLPYAFKARGSAVQLEPGTKYYFEFGTGDNFSVAAWAHHVVGTTRSETIPEDPNRITIPSQSATYVIPAGSGGTASASKVYDGWNGSSKNVVNRGGAGVGNAGAESDDTSHAIVVKANFVIVRRVRATGAAIAGIYIAPGVTDVVIEDSQVDDWAWRPETRLGANPNAWGTFGWNEAGGIHLAGSNARIVIQRNVIKAPHFGSFPWDTGGGTCGTNTHPAGPFGITVWDGSAGSQQNVIRYNDITGDPANNRKWYQDGIAGGENFSSKGAPGADSDIYRNIVMHAFDDAIEAEGGGRNVRVWGNYISDAKSAVATTIVHFGPTYVWRNVINRLRMCYWTDSDNDAAPSAFKYGGLEDGYGNGVRYLFHNTMLQEPQGLFPEGGRYGVEAPSNGDGSSRTTISRNNIFHVRKTPNDFSVDAGDDATGADFAYDVYNGQIRGVTEGTPASIYKFSDGQLFYKNGHGWMSVPALGGNGIGNYQLESGSKGLDVGEAVPNFSDGYQGSAPDAGAHESGSAAMQFGISAGE